MYDEQHFTRDSAVVEFDDSAEGITTDDDGEVQFDWDNVEKVTIENPPHAEAFDSKEFYKLPATVAKPIPQPYQYGEDAVWLKKPREELKKAAWSLDNAPWTLGHPDTGMVKDVDDVHGFWQNPRYIDSLDDLDADLHIPVEDEDAKEFVGENSDVSVAFYNRIARQDEYDGVVGGSDDENVEVEGYQTDMLFDHCASVEIGRCPGSAGCGLADSCSFESGRVFDTQRESNETSDSRGGSDTATDSEDGIRNIDDGPEHGHVAVVDEDSFKRDTVTTYKDDEADGTTSTMEETQDQPSGIKEEDGTWFAVGPGEHNKDSTDHPGDHMFPVDNCADVGDAWSLRNHAEGLSISADTLEARIQRAGEAHDCSDMPWENQDSPTMDDIAESADRYSISGRCADCGDEDDTNTDMEFDFDDLSTEAALAKVSGQHDGVDERLDELEEAEETAEVAEEAAEELDLDGVDDLADTVAMLKERKDELEERVDELQRPQMEEDAEFIAEHTDRFGEDAEEVIEQLDEEPEAVSDKRELVEELKEGYDEATANSDSGEGSEEDKTGASSKYAHTPFDK